MPIYSHAEDFKGISERLRKTLKGKSCLNITKLDDDLERQIVEIFDKGYKIYERFDGMG